MAVCSFTGVAWTTPQWHKFTTDSCTSYRWGVCLPVCLYVNDKSPLPIHARVTGEGFVYLSVCMSVTQVHYRFPHELQVRDLFTCLPVCLCVCLSVCLSVRQHWCVFVHFNGSPRAFCSEDFVQKHGGICLLFDVSSHSSDPFSSWYCYSWINY